MKKFVMAALLVILGGVAAVLLMRYMDVAKSGGAQTVQTNSTAADAFGSNADPVDVHGVWTVVGPPGTDYVIFIDPQSISESGDIVKYRYAFPETSDDGGMEPYTESRGWGEMDCAKYVDRTLKAALYRDGKLVESNDAVTPWKPVNVDDALQSHMYAFLCRDRKK